MGAWSGTVQGPAPPPIPPGEEMTHIPEIQKVIFFPAQQKWLEGRGLEGDPKLWAPPPGHFVRYQGASKVQREDLHSGYEI